MANVTIRLERARRAPVDRSFDRRLATAAIVIALAYLCLALGSAALPEATRRGLWLPLHLALAGAASTAIAGIMPFFSAAFAAAPPIDPRIRASAIGAVAVGAAGASLGFALGGDPLAALGGATYVAGIALTAVATLRPLARGLGPARGIVTRGYLLALLNVGLGAVLATLLVAGWPPVAAAWAGLRPAHAWLNLVGFVSLVIATTLLHFLPTVVGSRIVRDRSAALTIGGLAVGAPLVAAGYGAGWDPLARFGAIVVLVGGGALASYAWGAWRRRARWSTDHGWHRFAMGGLVSAIVWFELGILVWAGQVVLEGIQPAGVPVETFLGPLVAGWMGLSVVASATHLIPAVGPGDAAAHARQRDILGRAARLRLGAADAGVAAIAIGAPLGWAGALVVGGVLVGLALGSSVTLIAAAVAVAMRRP